jgi:tetratricopeptide (TPR) repeat protein
MKRKILFGGPVLAIALGVAAWLGWRWHTTPVPPPVALDGSDAAVVELIEGALAQVRRQPRSGPAWGKAGMALAAHGYTEQAVLCYIQAERFDAEDPRWLYLHAVELLSQNPPEALALIRRALQRTTTPQDRAAVLFRLARVLIENGELDDAEETIQALGTLGSDSPQVHFAVGLLDVARGESNAARQHLGTLVDNPCARKQACSLLATMTAADRDVALAYQEKAAKLPLDAPWPDRFEEEMRSLKVNRFSRVAPFYELQAQGRLPEALDFLRGFVAKSPDDEVRLLLGLELFKAHAFEEAAEVLRTAIGCDSRNVKAHLFLGASLCRSGEKRLREPGGNAASLELFRQSVAAADAALALQSDLAYAHLVRGQALKHLGRTEESIKALRAAVLCQSESVEMHLSLGEALAEAGHVREAFEYFENAVRLAGADDVHPREILKMWRAKAKASS